jgi:glycosyltransferase involved in cell wall biosynthesis
MTHVRGQPLVSVVTPAYNDERYVAECLDSVLRQTYSNWECVFLNNRSTDRTLEIAQSYAARDPRIRVHTNESFVPVLRNHNRALQLISPGSAYVKVVFSDDLLYPECIERMVALAEAHPSVGIVGAYALRGRKVVLDGLPYTASVLRGRDVCRSRLLGGEYLFGSPTSLLMRADLVRGTQPFYNEENLHADTEACFRSLLDCDFGFVHQVLTFSREDADSLRSYSRRLNTYLAGTLLDLVTYGPRLLSAAELHRQIEAALARYYKFLARSVLRSRDADFWQFHTESLRKLGYPLRRGRLARGVAALLLDAALNPKRTCEGLLASLRERRSTGQRQDEGAADSLDGRPRVES